MSRRALVISGLVGAAVLATVASFTRPFTIPADAVVLLGFAGLGVIGYVDRRMGTARSAATPAALPVSPSPGRFGPRWALWAGAFVVALAWELFCYFESPRRAHPTISSMLDTVDGHRPGHALVFAAWLWLAWRLVDR